MNEPNIFKYATSELSQDAFICYFLSFAKEKFKNEYKNEYDISKKFLKKFHIKEDIEDIKKQYKHIDILVITKNYILIIEDKTYTNEHNNQIIKYV